MPKHVVLIDGSTQNEQAYWGYFKPVNGFLYFKPQIDLSVTTKIPCNPPASDDGDAPTAPVSDPTSSDDSSAPPVSTPPVTDDGMSDTLIFPTPPPARIGETQN